MAAANKSDALTLTTPSDREVVVTREFDAPRALVFEAHTKPEHVSKWLLGPPGWTMPICEIDLRPGGKWRYVWRQEDGREMTITGVYQEITPPERIVSTESWGGDWPEAITTLTLTEKDGRTLLTQRILSPSKEARDATLKSGMAHGMSMSYDRLAEHLAGTL